MTIDALRIARSIAKDAAKGIGEPLIVLPTDQIFVHNDRDGHPVVSMRLDHFIALAEGYAAP